MESNKILFHQIEWNGLFLVLFYSVVLNLEWNFLCYCSTWACVTMWIIFSHLKMHSSFVLLDANEWNKWKNPNIFYTRHWSEINGMLFYCLTPIWWVVCFGSLKILVFSVLDFSTTEVSTLSGETATKLFSNVSEDSDWIWVGVSKALCLLPGSIFFLTTTESGEIPFICSGLSKMCVSCQK
jgi:hypothetical protein